MHYTPIKETIVGPITVHTYGFFNVDEKRVYENLYDALKVFVYYKTETNIKKPNSIFLSETYDFRKREYKFYDGCGDVIPVATLLKKIKELKTAREKNRKNFYGFYGKHVSEDHFRKLPVPSLRRRGRYRSSMDRHMKTSQELRENLSINDDEVCKDYGLKIRGKRKNLPTYWDDVPVAKNIHNWKEFRKTQWK